MGSRRATAPRRTPHKEKALGDYSALGIKGRYVQEGVVMDAFGVRLTLSTFTEAAYRRTGAELKDTGIRDENGLEPIPAFSSPAKSAIQPNGIIHDATYSADDSMDIDQSKTLPELHLLHVNHC